MAESEQQEFENPLPEVAGEPLPAFVAPAPQPIPAEPTPLVPEPDAVWELAKDLLVLGCIVVAVFISTGMVLAFAHSLPVYRNLALTTMISDPRVVVGAQAVSYPLVLAVMVVLVRIRTGEPFLRAIAWKWPEGRAPRFFLMGALLAFAIATLSRLLPIPKSLPIDKFFDTPTSAYLMSFFGILLAPLLEEMFFRGLLYPVLRRTLGMALGLLLTAAAFAAIHGEQLGNAWAPVFSIFIVGVALTLVRERTGSVAASFLTHCGYNTTLFVTLWFASDHFRHLEKVNV
jgi:membrane protease YdiL (CAAX protease family)